MKKKDSTVRIVFVLIFLFPAICVSAQDPLSILVPQNVSVSFNGTFIKKSLINDTYRCNSDNGVFGCRYDITGASDEARQINNFQLYENDRLLFDLSNPPGSEIEISNAGYVVFMDMRNHIRAELTLHFYSKSGDYLFSEIFTGASLFGFSPAGNIFGVGAKNGLALISIPDHTIDMYEDASRFAISEDEEYVAIANSNEIKVYSHKQRMYTLRTNLSLPRKISVSSVHHIVCAIDKQNLEVFSLKSGTPLFSDTVNGDDSYRDIEIYNGNILAGIHCRNSKLSKGSIKIYDIGKKSVLLHKEIAVKKIELDTHNASSRKIDQIQWSNTMGAADPNAKAVSQIQWPMQPFNQTHTVWNYHESLMASTGITPYVHQGLDIIAPIGEPIYAVEGGYVKCVLTLSAASHWRIAISPQQTSGYSDGWLYAHLIQSTIQFNAGDAVQAGDYLGDIIVWYADWAHLHFVQIRDHGTSWSYSDDQWGINFNPLLALYPVTDTRAPVIGNAFSDSKFGFFRNDTDTKLSPASLSGDVDIVVKIEDYIGSSTWTQPAYETYYWVAKLPENSVVFPRTLGQKLNHPYSTYEGAEYQAAAPVIYKFNTQFPALDWFTQYRNFYHILTNNNGDETLSTSERSLSFRTANYADGNYRIYVEAKDISGNTTTQSMDVTFKNGSSTDTQAPTVPANLTASNVTQTSVQLSWTASTDNVGVTGYDVYQNGVLKGSSTSTTYTVTGLTCNMSYSFTVRAKDAAGNASAASAARTVVTSACGTVPAITTQPVSRTVTVGQTATFSVVVTGAAPLSYQWYKNGVIISGASAASYTTPAATTADNGAAFYVRVSNSYGSINSNTVTLTVTSSTTFITVTAPNGGEQWQRGTTQTIRWISSGVTNVKIELLKTGVLNRTITSSTAASAGTYNWAILSTQEVRSDYTIRITSTTSSTVRDVSNATFSITSTAAASVTVTSPNGGESWAVGTTHAITWTSTGVTNVKIELLSPAGITTITSSTSASTGSFNLVIPSTQEVRSDYIIRITSTTSSAVTDSSNASFSITSSTPTTLAVVAPNGGEQWTRGSTYAIRWTAPSSTTYIDVALYNGTTFVQWITYYRSASTGTYNWTIPTTLTAATTYKVTIIDYIQRTLTDSSNAAFQIN